MIYTQTCAAHADGWLYIKIVMTSEHEPVQQISWWPLGWNVASFCARYGDADLEQPVTSPIRAFPSRYETRHSIAVSLKDGPQTYTSYVERVEIPCPALRGRQKGLPTRWVGAWQICTKKGWHTL